MPWAASREALDSLGPPTNLAAFLQRVEQPFLVLLLFAMPRDLQALAKAHLHIHLEGAMRRSTL